MTSTERSVLPKPRGIILVIGATGFLGKAIAADFLKRGYCLILTSRNLPEESNRLTGCRYVTLDLATCAGFENIPWNEVGIIFLLAAAGVKAASRNPRECYAVNVIGLNKLLIRLANLPTPPKILHAKSFYEDCISSRSAEDEDHYALSKKIGSEILSDWRTVAGIGISFVKIFQVYGPGDNPNNVLSYAACQCLAKKPGLFSSGRSRKDWIYVDDLVRGFYTAYISAQWNGEVFDLGSGTLTSVREMIETIAAITHTEGSLLTFDPSRDRRNETDEVFAKNFPSTWRPQLLNSDGLKQLISNI